MSAKRFIHATPAFCVPRDTSIGSGFVVVSRKRPTKIILQEGTIQREHGSAVFTCILRVFECATFHSSSQKPPTPLSALKMRLLSSSRLICVIMAR